MQCLRVKFSIALGSGVDRKIDKSFRSIILLFEDFSGLLL